MFPKSKNPCLFFAKITITFSLGSGWCSVGRVVAFDIRSKSNYRKTFILNVCLLSTVLKSPYWKNLVGDVKTKCSPIISNYFKQFLLHRYVYQNSPKIQQTLGHLCKKFVTKNCKNINLVTLNPMTNWSRTMLPKPPYQRLQLFLSQNCFEKCLVINSVNQLQNFPPFFPGSSWKRLDCALNIFAKLNLR